MATSKPSLVYAWAESGSKTDPGSTKTQAGFGAEIPTAEEHNFIWNRSDTFCKHVNENGIPVWDAVTDYTEGALTLSGGILYRSLQTPNVNKTPASQPTYWQVVINEDIADALQGAATPSSSNVFATMDDLADLALTTKVFISWVDVGFVGTPKAHNDLNVASLDDDGTGQVGVNFTSAYGDAYFIAVGQVADSGSTLICVEKARTTGSVDYEFRTNATGNLTDPDIGFNLLIN